MNKRREYGPAIAASVPATAASIGSDRGAAAFAGKHSTRCAEQQPGEGQQGERAGEPPGERAQKQARKKPTAGSKKAVSRIAKAVSLRVHSPRAWRRTLARVCPTGNSASPAAPIPELIMPRTDIKQEKLDEEVEHILEESRMVLPGIQALFGFQLIAVFNSRFDEVLGHDAQVLHLVAVVLTALAIALIMAPAAYHRQVERGSISRYLADYASRLLTIGMAPLLTALAIEVSLVAFMILRSVAASSAIGTGLLLIFGWLWYGFPAQQKRRRAPSRAASLPNP